MISSVSSVRHIVRYAQVPNVLCVIVGSSSIRVNVSRNVYLAMLQSMGYASPVHVCIKTRITCVKCVWRLICCSKGFVWRHVPKRLISRIRTVCRVTLLQITAPTAHPSPHAPAVFQGTSFIYQNVSLPAHLQPISPRSQPTQPAFPANFKAVWPVPPPQLAHYARHLTS